MRRRLIGRNSLHVLVFGVRWPPESFLGLKFERLAARGVRVTVASASPDASFELPGVSVVNLWRPLAGLSAAARLVLRNPRRLRAVVAASGGPTADGRPVRGRERRQRLVAYARLAGLRPDVVHFEWNTAAVHFSSLIDALGVPAVISRRGGSEHVYPHAPGTRRLADGFPLTLAKAAAVHCVSEAARSESLRHGLDPAKSWLIRPAVDAAFFSPEPRRPDGTFRLTSVGALRWSKGHEYALLAVAALARDGIPVELELLGADAAPEVGEPAESARLRATILDLGLGTRVRLRGEVRPTEVRAALRRSDALLHLSLAEGLPNAVLEAMACGLPVVASDVDGTGEALRHGVDGFLVPPRDPAAAADALRALWHDPALCARLGTAGRARVEAEFAVERQIDQWLELYERVRGARVARSGRRLVEIGLRWPPETFLRRKLQNLAAAGYETRVVSWDSSPGGAAIVVPGVHHDPPLQMPGLLADGARLVARPRRAVRLAAAVRRKNVLGLRSLVRLSLVRADVVHFEWPSSAIDCLPLFRVWKAPVVVSAHGTHLQVRPHGARRMRERLAVDLPRLFAEVDAVHCVSEAVLTEALRLGAPREKTWLVRQTVDGDFFRPPALPRPEAGELRLLSVGWLRWIKGHEYALLAVAEVADAGVPIRFDIVGDDPPADWGEGEQSRRIRYTIDDLGLRDRVRLWGMLDRDGVRARLWRSDVFLQLSLSEGLPNTVLEAMACALPVVAADAGGTREAVRDGIEGLLVRPRDPSAAAEALRTLWLDPSLRARLGAAGRQRALAEFDPARETRGFVELYESLLSGRRAA
jgi:glycosyltransferase involved in cell wall biosynthesis